MSKLYGTMKGDAAKTTVTRSGHRNMECHVATWTSGIKVVAGTALDGTIVFDVYKTSGSNGTELHLIGRYK